MLWFDTQAEDAVNLYLSIFKDGKINNISHGPEGKVFTVDFELLGEGYIALNGGPTFTFNEAFSIFLTVDGQEEVNQYWNALTADGGQAGRCGWLKDKFGLSWQIIPQQLRQHLGSADRQKAAYAMEAMMKMTKIEIKDLEK